MTVTNVMAMNVVRAKTVPARPRGRIAPFKWVLIAIAAAAVVLATCWYDWYYGSLGLLAPQPVIEANPAGGRIIRVPPGGNISAALERAQSGDVVELQAGAVYSGTVRLPNKELSDFVTIRSSAAAALPEDKRVSPAQRASMAMITGGLLTKPAVLAANGAHHYRFVGIEFGPTTKGYFNIIQIGTGNETSLGELPHHIEFDRVYVHGDPKLGQRRGIAANGRFLKITNSYLSDFKREGEESQAIAFWATDGHIEIVNNYLEAAAENILIGGAENQMGLVAADCLIKDNWMNKPLEWRGSKWTIKNFLEIKSGRRVRIETNLFTNNWQQAQEGTGILFRSAVDSGEQAVVEDVEFVSNIVRGSGSAVNIFGDEGRGGRNLIIRNNVFEDISGAKWEGRGFFIKSTAFDNVLVENNTVIHDGSITLAYGKPVTKFVFRGNVVFNNDYGFFGDGAGAGRPAIAKYFPGAVIDNNVLVGGSSSDYGTSNYYPTEVGKIGFSDAKQSDYRLRPDSMFFSKGVGANLDPRSVGGR